MILKSDGQKINIEFSQEILGNVQSGGNSRWVPSSFDIDFSVPSYVPYGALNSKNLEPISVTYAPAYDNFHSLVLADDSDSIEIKEIKTSSGITLPIMYLEFVSALED